jgi:hypothetical protein
MTSRGIKQLDAASGGHVEFDFQVTIAGDLFSLADITSADLHNQAGITPRVFQLHQAVSCLFSMSK